MKRFILTIDAFTDRFGRGLSWIVLAIAGMVAYEVIARFIFNSPTRWSHEVSALVYGIYGILAGGYCLLHGSHVRVDVLWGRLSPRGKAIADLANSVLWFTFMVLLLWFAIPWAWNSFQLREHSETVFGAPFYPTKMALVLGTSLLLLQMIAKFIRDLYIAINKTAMTNKRGIND